MYGSWKITGRDCQYVLVMNVQEIRCENELEHYILISPEKKPYNEDTEKETHTSIFIRRAHTSQTVSEMFVHGPRIHIRT